MSHTEGKLVADALDITLNGAQSNYYCIGKTGTRDVVAIIGEVGDGKDELSRADARRLVACWNACEGVSTESLETGELNVSDLAERNLNLSDERDELVKALRKVVEWNNKYPSNRVFSHYEIVRIAEEMDGINSEAVAILARYQEGK